MLKTQTNNHMTAHQEPTAEEINQAWEEESDLMEGPITPGEIDQMANRIAQSQALATFSTQPMDLDQFRMIKEHGKLRSSYTGVKTVALEDYFNKELRVKGFFVQHLRNVDEETGVVAEWDDLRIKLHDDTVISCSGKGALAFIRELEGQGFPQGDWPEEVVIRVHRRKLNSVTKDGQPKYMPTFQIVG